MKKYKKENHELKLIIDRQSKSIESLAQEKADVQTLLSSVKTSKASGELSKNGHYCNDSHALLVERMLNSLEKLSLDRCREQQLSVNMFWVTLMKS